MRYYITTKSEWDKKLDQLLLSHTIFATVSNDLGLDFEFLRPADIDNIKYNCPRPVTSLKTFFLPPRENVTADRDSDSPRIIIGAPNCDIEGLSLLDEIYLDRDFKDMFFNWRRKNTIIVATDCFSYRDNCHCVSYGIKPFTTRIADMSVSQLNGTMIFRCITDKGEAFIKTVINAQLLEDKNFVESVENNNTEVEKTLTEKNKGLPDYARSGKLLESAGKNIWKKYSSDCVSCGSCTTICPTCSCFLLIDKPGFEKVKQMDTCQYPGFERVAGGEDALYELSERFRNRYMCKYVWKPKKYRSTACTGCGRCIDSCLGKINKNELIMELVK